MNEPRKRRNRTEFDLDSFIPYRLSLLANTVSQGISETYRQEHELSVTQWRIIAVLGQFPGLTASQVTRRTAMDKVAVSRAVKSLLVRGLIERELHSTDRRRKPLRLTATEGRRLHDLIVPRAKSYESELLATLSSSDRAGMNDLLARLQAAAETLNAR
jgi:DNA-binding MarR family transcriptional regulator